MNVPKECLKMIPESKRLQTGHFANSIFVLKGYKRQLSHTTYADFLHIFRCDLDLPLKSHSEKI